MSDCNTNTTKGCTDDQSYSKLVVTQPKILTKLEDIESTLDVFSSALTLYCEHEQLHLTEIKERVTTVVNINTECCNLLNQKLQQLKAAIIAIRICGEVTTTPEPTTTGEPTTTSEITTTVEGTTTVEITTTAEPTTTGLTTTTPEPTTTTEPGTTIEPIYLGRYFNEETKVSETMLIDTSGNNRDLTLTRRNCLLGDGTAKLTFSGLPAYDALTIVEDGVETVKSLTASELVLTNAKKYNYAIFKNVGIEVAKFPLMEHDSDYDIDATINLYDVIGTASCVLTSGSSANISKADGLSWNFEHGFAVEAGYYTQYPRLEDDTWYAGITDEVIVGYSPYSLNANQYIKAPVGDAEFITADTDEQFYSSGTPADVNLADINNSTFVEITTDANIVTDLILNYP